MENFKKMQVLNTNAAGIDVGSRSHFVAVGQEDNQIKEFNVYQSGLTELVVFLKTNQIKTIAMESTGSYWQSLFMLLQSEGFEVILVQGTQTKNLKAKTDVKDAQWIQKLHSLGLLRGSFLPCESTLQIRTLHRHGESLVEESVKYVNKMQKALRLMNFRLDVAISDIVGVSGIRIIKSILSGETSGEKLAENCDKPVKKSKEEIADALQGKINPELLHELSDCFDIYLFIQEKIKKNSLKINEVLQQQTQEIVLPENIEMVKKNRSRKKEIQLDVQSHCCKLFGVDLFAIECISEGTVASFLAEVGTDIYKFQTAKQFVSWLRLAPNNKISGGKILSSKTPKGKNKFALTLRNAANSIDRKKEGYLMLFFKRVAYKKGRGAAITATARKIAIIMWNMIVKRTHYSPVNTEEYIQEMKTKKILQINKMIKKYKIETNYLSVI
ncbi:IS110 family transposase [Flavobacterium marginilacus]|uniref:IS110 family transposase n=2 Tax=Flavobacterium TaxID=237 RepID=UPI00248D9466|nr:IS110 family transposase [Flavobacterium marginilacus]